MCSNYFTCSITNRKYYARGFLHCNCNNVNCNNVIYLINNKFCLEQYVGSAVNSKSCFKIKKRHLDQKRHVELQDTLLVSAKILLIFFSQFTFKLLSK